jgi:hypothetical protein
MSAVAEMAVICITIQATILLKKASDGVADDGKR